MNSPSPSPTSPGRTALSVNVNKVALLRNSRQLDIPNVCRAAELCLQAGAQGITVHPRPDQRHIRTGDVYELAALMQDWPGREFNIEGNPLHNLMGLVRELKERGLPLHQCTLVPDSENQLTSDHGWQLPQSGEHLAALIAQIQTHGVRVSLFMDPLPETMLLAKELGADRVELYTEGYARAASAEKKQVLQLFRQTAQAAQAVGLGVNAGHDLNLHNLGDFLQAVPGVLEVSIGHALMADALEQGYSATVKNYLHRIAQTQGQP